MSLLLVRKGISCVSYNKNLKTKLNSSSFSFSFSLLKYGNGRNGSQLQRRQLSSESSDSTHETHEKYETYEERLAKAKAKVPMGMTIVGIGITFLTLNERRDVQQAALTERARHLCETCDAQSGKLPRDDLNGHIVHVSGPVVAEAPVPIDDLLKVSHPSALRLSRITEMYQWKEHEQSSTTTHKDGSKTTRTSYTYTKEWAPMKLPILHSVLHRNPAFPDHLKSSTFEAGALTLGKVKFHLCQQMVCQMDQFTKLYLSRKITEKSKSPLSSYKLRVTSDESMLYSSGGNPNNPTIGDIRIQYIYVPQAYYTAVGKLTMAAGSNASRAFAQLSPYTEAMKHKLRDQGDILAPSEGDDLAKVVGYETFIIPEECVVAVEDFFHLAVPIQVCFIHDGILSRSECFEKIKASDEETSWMLRIIGTLICIYGSKLSIEILAVMKFMGVSSTLATAIRMGLSLAIATMYKSRRQIHAPPLDEFEVAKMNDLLKSLGDQLNVTNKSFDTEHLRLNSEGGCDSVKEWKAVLDRHGRKYFWNPLTNQTSWSRPKPSS